ncbi:MAG: HD domain-containing protein [Mollicutes bacterium]|nr:HD domain-containing protein [Mollicutes bacterium]
MDNELIKMDENLKKYFNMLEKNFPEFLNDYINTKEMQRLGYISVSCGTIYSKLYDLGYYSSLSHSIGVALIIWHFTHDKKQTLAGLFHDIATPVFKHTIDFLNGDYMKQETTEKLTAKIIKNSTQIRALLKRDKIRSKEVVDYHIYPIADNEIPKLSADRLEYTMSNALIVYKCENLEKIREIYNSIDVLKEEIKEANKTNETNEENEVKEKNEINKLNKKNEQNEINKKDEQNETSKVDLADNELELGFTDIKKAEEFVAISSKLSIKYRDDKTRYSMQFLADIVKKLNKEKNITKKDLYEKKESEIIELIENSDCKEEFEKWKNATKIITSKNKPTETQKDIYCVNQKAKIRYIDPLVQIENKQYQEEKGKMRILRTKNERASKVSNLAKKLIEENLKYDMDKYIYLEE